MHIFVTGLEPAAETTGELVNFADMF